MRLIYVDYFPCCTRERLLSLYSVAVVDYSYLPLERQRAETNLVMCEFYCIRTIYHVYKRHINFP